MAGLHDVLRDHRSARGSCCRRQYFEQVAPMPSSAAGRRGPYRFVSQRPASTSCWRASPTYWRHAPYIKRLHHEERARWHDAARHAQERREDLAFFLVARRRRREGDSATAWWRRATRRSSGSSSRPVGPQVDVHDKRLRLAVNYALVARHEVKRPPGLLPPAGVIVRG